MVGNRFERDAAERAVAVLTGVRGIIDDIDIFSDVKAADVSDLVQGALVLDAAWRGVGVKNVRDDLVVTG